MNEHSLVEHAATAPPSLLTIIERIALNPQVDIDRLERLLALRERMEDREYNREAERQFDEAFAAAQAEMPRVVKNSFNPQTKSRYASLDAVLVAVMPSLTKRGLCLSFSRDPTPPEGFIIVTARVAGYGFSRTWSRPTPVSSTGLRGNQNMTPTHADASAESYGKRYLCNSIFALSIGEDDDDGNGAWERHAPPAEEGAPAPRSEMAQRCYDEIVKRLEAETDAAAARNWWNSEEAKKERADMLDRETHVEALALAKKRIAELEAAH